MCGEATLCPENSFMKKVSLLVLSAAIAVSALFACVVSSEARPAYKKEWEAKYLKMVPAAEQAKCNVCHVGEKKKDRNVYGQALAKLLTKDDMKDIPKIQKAL